jgi:hypothetical protein
MLFFSLRKVIDSSHLNVIVGSGNFCIFMKVEGTNEIWDPLWSRISL